MNASLVSHNDGDAHEETQLHHGLGALGTPIGLAWPPHTAVVVLERAWPCWCWGGLATGGGACGPGVRRAGHLP